MAKHRYSVRTRILVPLFLGFLLMSMAFIGISFKVFRDYTVEDCVNYAYGLNGLVADSLDVDHIGDYMALGRDHPDYGAMYQEKTAMKAVRPD